MTLFRKCLYLLPVALTVTLIAPLQAQENQVPTQTLVAIDAKTSVAPTPSNVSIKVDNRSTPLISINRVAPAGAEVALLIDDGLRVSVGRELGSLRAFVSSLRPGTSIFIGYMQNGRVVPAQNFTRRFRRCCQGSACTGGRPRS